MSSNTFMVYDEDGDTPDWFEIINTGNEAINLSEFYVSESKKNLLKWQLPDFNLQPGKTFLVYASGKDRKQIENLLIAVGHAMMGVSLAPVTGKIISDLVDGKPDGFYSDFLSPNRF